MKQFPDQTRSLGVLLSKDRQKSCNLVAVAQRKTSQMIVRAFLGLWAVALAACVTAPQSGPKAPLQASPTPKPSPLIAYLYEGGLWVMEVSGANARPIVASPEGEAINAYVWSLDGSRIYFSVGLKLFAVSLRDRKLEEAGELMEPPGTTIDRLEVARDGETLIAFVLPAMAEFNALPMPFAIAAGQHAARQLTVDEYYALAQPQSVAIRSLNDLAVSPDGRSLLFKETVGGAAQLFISDIETGARRQVTDLNALDGFEESATLSGERQILEAAWSPDSRYIVFNPAQSCSETGLCYGRLFLVSAWGGPQFQLSREMVVGLPMEWNGEGTLLTYDDGGQVLLADTQGQIKRLAEGNRPRWQMGR
jgi:hypothetical protein